MANVYKIESSRGGLSDYEDKGTPGSFKFGKNLDIRKIVDSISCGQALIDIGVTTESPSVSQSPSASVSPSSSVSPSTSLSVSPSASASPSPQSPSASISPSASVSPSASASPSASVSPSSSVSPSPSPASGLSVFKDLIRHFVKATDGYIYGFGHLGKVYKINPDDKYVQQVYDARSPITGAEEKPASDTNYLVFATHTEVHIKALPGNSNWNDINTGLANWPKTNLEHQAWHTMKQIDGDVLIANGSKVAFIGYDNSYTNEAVELIPGNIVKTIVERNGHGIFGTYRASDPNKGINGAVESEVSLCQVGDDGEIYFANMVDSVPVKRFPGGGKVNPGGATNLIDQVNLFDWQYGALNWIDKQEVGNMALFGVYGGESGKNGIYTYGRKYKNHPFVLNLEYALDADEIGAVTAVDGIVYASYKDGDTYGVKVVDMTTKATGVYEGLDFKAPIKDPKSITTWSMHEVYCKALPSGCSIEFWYRINKNGDFIQAKTVSGQDSFSAVGETQAVFRIGEQGQIFEPRLVLNPSGNLTPDVYRQQTLFE